ncbi:hypothetical protein IJI55_01100 [Candidatus Saccharibacteria bacterium]|nr:hypothetical protein [Candidatus Saccharibacteria bacterium]
MKTPPDSFEKAIARLLSDYFHSDIKFVDTASTSMPDIRVERLNQIWEIKRIDGNKKDTIHHALGRAKKQSANVIIATGRTRFRPQQIIGYIKKELEKRKDTKKLIFIDRQGNILVIKGRV